MVILQGAFLIIVLTISHLIYELGVMLDEGRW